MPLPSVQTLLVPQGAEFQAVQRGLRRVGATVTVLPIPLGMAAVRQFLAGKSFPVSPWATTAQACKPCLDKLDNLLEKVRQIMETDGFTE